MYPLDLIMTSRECDVITFLSDHEAPLIYPVGAAILILFAPLGYSAPSGCRPGLFTVLFIAHMDGAILLWFVLWGPPF